MLRAAVSVESPWAVDNCVARRWLDFYDDGDDDDDDNNVICWLALSGREGRNFILYPFFHSLFASYFSLSLSGEHLCLFLLIFCTVSFFSKSCCFFREIDACQSKNGNIGQLCDGYLSVRLRILVESYRFSFRQCIIDVVTARTGNRNREDINTRPQISILF